MFRPGYPQRPALVASMARPTIHGAPIVSPAIRPAVATPEKPQTTVYVGKIAPSVDNDFLLSVLRLCGPVKSWKRAQDPSNGLPKGFGFCEFESAEGVLRALRLLSKLNIDGQELVLNINQATREYLERYVESRTEKEKPKVVETGSSDKEVENSQKNLVYEDAKRNGVDSGDKEKKENNQTFGIVTDEDCDVDKEALEKLSNMIEERVKIKPPPPPSVPSAAEAYNKSNSETNIKLKNGDSDIDMFKSDAAEDKNEDETTSKIEPVAESDKLDSSSPDRVGRHDRSRERDRERDLKRERDWEAEKYEREHERERVRRDRDRSIRLRESERMYKERVKEWEARERDKENHRKKEKDREKDREWERLKEISRQENESDDEDIRRRRRRTSMYEERRRKRQREKEEDLADSLREEEEILEAKKREIELRENIVEDKILPSQTTSGGIVKVVEKENIVDNGVVKSDENEYANGIVGSTLQNVSSDDQMQLIIESDTKRSSSPCPVKKLGFGLVGSGKRTTVPSVFSEADDENVEEKKMRPLVPIDYSTDELHAVRSTASLAPPNIAAAAEFAKRISGPNPKEERFDSEKERNLRSSDKSGLRDRDRLDDDSGHVKGGSKEKTHKSHEHGTRTENKKLFDAKQLIDTIPKTKEELFSYEINWDVYDKHKLHERMRPWVSKKITEFLGEEEDTLVDFIMKSTKEHVQAFRMLELLQAILDDEAEMFVLKMWRMLIFEIRKVETGLDAKSRA